MIAGMFIGPALVFDPATQRCDLAFDGTDLALDLTPGTTLLVAVGSDRRAHPDDVLPDVAPPGYAPAALNARRGYPGDALDALGRYIGSRLWLLRRRKQTEATRRLAESIVAEAVGFFETDLAMPVTLTVRWVVAGMLGIWVKLGAQTMSLTVPVGG